MANDEGRIEDVIIGQGVRKDRGRNGSRTERIGTDEEYMTEDEEKDEGDWGCAN